MAEQGGYCHPGTNISMHIYRSCFTLTYFIRNLSQLLADTLPLEPAVVTQWCIHPSGVGSMWGRSPPKVTVTFNFFDADITVKNCVNYSS